MLNLNDDRTSDETLVDFSAPEKSRVSGSRAAVSIRVCTGKGDQIFNSAIDRSSANCLVSDVIRGSGGVPRTGRGRMLIADFPDVQGAVLAARRLQWALEGLAEYEICREGAAAILVQSAGEASNEDLVYRILESSQAGTILLSRSVYGYVNGLPGLTLGGSTDEDWHDLSWHGGPDDASSFAADERSVLRLIRAAGHTDPGSGRSNVPVARPTPAPVKWEIREEREAEAHETVIRPRPDREPPIEGSKKRPLILIASAVVICLVGLAIYFLRPKPLEIDGGQVVRQPTVPPKPAEPPKAPSPAAPLQDTSTTQEPSPKPVPEPPKGTQAAGPPPAPRGACEVNERNVEGTLDRADALMHDGQLSQAKANYLLVQGCATQRGRAQAGLARVNQLIKYREESTGP